MTLGTRGKFTSVLVISWTVRSFCRHASGAVLEFKGAVVENLNCHVCTRTVVRVYA